MTVRSDGFNDYLYGQSEMSVEQINTKEEAQHLHHDRPA